MGDPLKSDHLLAFWADFSKESTRVVYYHKRRRQATKIPPSFWNRLKHMFLPQVRPTSSIESNFCTGRSCASIPIKVPLYGLFQGQRRILGRGRPSRSTKANTNANPSTGFYGANKMLVRTAPTSGIRSWSKDISLRYVSNAKILQNTIHFRLAWISEGM